MDVIATAHGFFNPDELAYCPALVVVAVYYHDNVLPRRELLDARGDV